MKRTIFSLFIALLSLAAFAGGTSKIVFTDPVYDFGNVKENGGIVSHEFVVKNTGKAPLIIKSARASCGCTVPEIPKEPIMPGKTAVVKVSYDPKGRPGEFEKSIQVKSNASSPRTTLKIKGVVIPSSK
ncbi:MAG: DUF1573 domain-containing protein [Bacteroides sp.]|nr:DUF1573 domain-containing protein [Bacteroides sp.]